MKIYLISQSENQDYDTYDSAVVFANSEEEARQMYPGYADGKPRYASSVKMCWAPPSQVLVQYLGHTNLEEQPRVVCASFNAG